MLRFCEDLVKHTAIVEIFDLRCFPAAEILAYGDKVQLRENARIFSGHLGVPGSIEIPGDRILRGRSIKILQIGLRELFLPVLFGICVNDGHRRLSQNRSEEHTSELHSLMRISYSAFCLNKITKY